MESSKSTLAKKKRILVVDDEESIRTTIGAILEQEGYEVDSAPNGENAIQKSNDKFFDLALVDMRLPDMYGYQILAGMRETVPKMAKIIVTGYPSMQTAIAAINEGGVDGYILKPVDADLLLAEIKKQLQRREESVKYSQEKVAEFIMTRARELGISTENHQATPGNNPVTSKSSPADLEEPWKE